MCFACQAGQGLRPRIPPTRPLAGLACVGGVERVDQQARLGGHPLIALHRLTPSPILSSRGFAVTQSVQQGVFSTSDFRSGSKTKLKRRSSLVPCGTRLGLARRLRVYIPHRDPSPCGRGGKQYSCDPPSSNNAYPMSDHVGAWSLIGQAHVALVAPLRAPEMWTCWHAAPHEVAASAVISLLAFDYFAISVAGVWLTVADRCRSCQLVDVSHASCQLGCGVARLVAFGSLFPLERMRVAAGSAQPPAPTAPM